MTLSVTFDGKSSWKSCICKLEQGQEIPLITWQVSIWCFYIQGFVARPSDFPGGFQSFEGWEQWPLFWQLPSWKCCLLCLLKCQSSQQFPLTWSRRAPGKTRVQTSKQSSHLIVFISGRINTLKKTQRLISWARLSPLSVLLVSVTVDRGWNPEVPPWQE